MAGRGGEQCWIQRNIYGNPCKWTYNASSSKDVASWLELVSQKRKQKKDSRLAPLPIPPLYLSHPTRLCSCAVSTQFSLFFLCFPRCCPSKSPQNATRTAATNDQRQRQLPHSRQMIINKFIRRSGSSTSCGIHKRLLITRSLATVSQGIRVQCREREREKEWEREREKLWQVICICCWICYTATSFFAAALCLGLWWKRKVFALREKQPNGMLQLSPCHLPPPPPHHATPTGVH